MQHQNLPFAQTIVQQAEANLPYISPDLKLLHKLEDLVEQNFRSVHDHEFYAQTLGLTISRLNNLTHFYLNRTVYELIQDRIHEEAKYLLKHTALSAKQISYELGTCDPSYFGRCFRKREGVSPNAFRRQVQI